MKVATCDQMRQIDHDTICNIGIPGMVLMENAALQVVKEVDKFLKNVSGKNIVIFCGKGNNGGDGFAVARHLFNGGANVQVVLLASRTDLKGDALQNFNIIKKIGVEVTEILDAPFLNQIVEGIDLCDLIVDAILGTGTKGEVTGLLADAIRMINRSGKHIISVDIPSGINGDTGQICGLCVHADETVTFALPKIGLLNDCAADDVGELIIADISVPDSIIKQQNMNINTIEKDDIKNLFPVRRRNSNKGSYGKVFIVAGSVGMTGAAVLSASAALRSGSGLVTVGCPDSLNRILEVKLTEAMTYPLQDDHKGVLSKSCLNQLLEKMGKSDVLLFGPGLSMHTEILEVLKAILQNHALHIPVIIDADGINALSSNINVLKQCNCPVILTPHPGEMSRLTGLDISTVQGDRVGAARSFAVQWNVTLVLKGARTVVAAPDGTIFINTTGNPGMATGGTGDVLGGIIASFIGQGLSVNDAAIAGVYVHGLAGDAAAEQKGENGLIASDLIDALPCIFQELVR